MADIKYSLFQRENRRWVLSIAKDGDWKRPQQITAPKEVRTKADSRVWLETKLREITQTGGIVTHNPRAGILVSEAWPKVKKVRGQHPDIRPATLQNYDAHMTQHILPALGTHAMSQVGVPEARAFIRAIRAKVAPNTCRNIFSTARMLWDVAAGEGLTRCPNPFRTQPAIDELPKAKTVANEVIVLRRDDAQALVDCADIPIGRRVRYVFALTSGLSDGEIAGLRWSSVYDGLIRVSHAFAQKGGMGVTKTENRIREIPMHTAVKEAPPRLAGGLGASRASAPPSLGLLLFPDDEGEPERPNSARILRMDLRAAKLADQRGEHNVTFHALRRSFSTFLRAAGIDVETRGLLMGHAGKTVTERNYTDEEMAPLAAAVSKIPLTWGSVQETVRTENLPAQKPCQSDAKTLEKEEEVRMRFELTYVGFASRRLAVHSDDKGERSIEQTSDSGPPAIGYEDSVGLRSEVVAASAQTPDFCDVLDVECAPTGARS